MPAAQGGAVGCWHLRWANKNAYRTKNIMKHHDPPPPPLPRKTYALPVYNRSAIELPWQLPYMRIAAD